MFTDSVGLVTIPSVKTYHFGTRLELTGPPPNTGAPPDARPELRLGPLANPVRGRAVIAGSWAHDGPARVELFDASGRIARAIWRGAARAGAWRVEADLAGLAPGVYLLRAEQGGARRVRRLVVLR